VWVWLGGVCGVDGDGDGRMDSTSYKRDKRDLRECRRTKTNER
jgi:hypothetical protein